MVISDWSKMAATGSAWNKLNGKLPMGRLITCIIEYAMKCHPKPFICIETSIILKGEVLILS